MPESFEEMGAALLPIGRTGSGGHDRRGLSEVERALHDWFAGQCRARGLGVKRDSVGNTIGWWGDEGDAVLTGSYRDSVPEGGAYDGPLGVVSALAAIAVAAFVEEGVGCFVELHIEQGRALDVPVGVAALTTGLRELAR